MLRKGIYDKVAASVILQRYLDFYNSEDDILSIETKRQKLGPKQARIEQTKSAEIEGGNLLEGNSQ